jgi:hypothetical protein
MPSQELRQFAELTTTQHAVAVAIKPNEERFDVWFFASIARTIRTAATFRASRLRAARLGTASAGKTIIIRAARTSTSIAIATFGTALAALAIRRTWATPRFRSTITIRAIWSAATLGATISVTPAYARRRIVAITTITTFAHRVASRFPLFVVQSAIAVLIKFRPHTLT